jgi:hypothetical protein
MGMVPTLFLAPSEAAVARIVQRLSAGASYTAHVAVPPQPQLPPAVRLPGGASGADPVARADRSN